jgi:cytochrome c biogenesis protein
MGSSPRTQEKNAVWRFFSSVKLTLFLLILVAAASIVGTVIPQREGMLEFARGLSPGMLEVFSTLQLFDVYHSIWFRVLISGLTLNLVVCSLDRLPGILRRFKAAPRPDRRKPFENVHPDQVFSASLPVEQAADRVEALLRQRYARPTREDTQGVSYLCGERGRYSLFGVYIVHLSVLFILMGSIVGSLFGFEAFVNIPEQERIDTVRLRKTGEPHKLPFQIECVDFMVEFYDNGTPKEYQSRIRFLHDGHVEEAILRVNHPATFEGIRFYQSSYGTIPGNEVKLSLLHSGIPGEKISIQAKQGKPMDLPGGEGRFVVEDIREDFMRMGLGPAVRISVRPAEGDEVPFWVFLHPERVRQRFSQSLDQFPKLNPSAFAPYTFQLDDVAGRYYTGLQVNRDPGVPLVWTGFFMISIGLFISFFMSHRRVRIRIEPAGNHARLTVAGSANKNPVGLQRELDSLISRLREHLEAQESPS